MELWIRSQDKKVLTICNYFDVNDEGEIIIYDGCPIAKYKTKERALEVLEEIQDIIVINYGYELATNSGIRPDNIKPKGYTAVYEMPKE